MKTPIILQQENKYSTGNQENIINCLQAVNANPMPVFVEPGEITANLV